MVEYFDVLDNVKINGTQNPLRQYTVILKDKPKYPVFYDADRHALSLPPIVNSEYSKISYNTKNVWVDMTGTDLTKLKICLAILCAQFSEHCQGDSKFSIEPVEVIYQED